MSEVTPSGVKIQVEPLSFRSPVSEWVLQRLGAAINFLLNNSSSVGDVVWSALTEAQFQSERGTNWVLFDNRNIQGSRLAALTGWTNLPDMRGTYPRMKDNGRGLNPAGNLAIGAYQGDDVANHLHGIGTRNGSAGGTGWIVASDGGGAEIDATTSGNGGSETRPKTTTLNAFIRIN